MHALDMRLQIAIEVLSVELAISSHIQEAQVK